MITKTKPNYKILGLGSVLMLPPAWVVFQGLRTGYMPTPVALFSIGGLMAISVVMIYQGLLSVEKGYVRAALIEFLIAGAVMLAEFVGQWWFAITLHHPLATALPLSIMALGGAACIESELLRVWRENLVATGQQTIPRAQCPRELRRVYPQVAMIFERIAVRYPKYTQRLVLEMAWDEYDSITPEIPVSVRVDSIPPNVGGQKSGQKALTSGDSGDLLPNVGTVSDLVRAAMSAHPADKAAAMALVIRTRPDTNPDTVRKAYDRLAKPRSA